MNNQPEGDQSSCLLDCKRHKVANRACAACPKFNNGRGAHGNLLRESKASDISLFRGYGMQEIYYLFNAGLAVLEKKHCANDSYLVGKVDNDHLRARFSKLF
jgi:hypothetical protein